MESGEQKENIKKNEMAFCWKRNKNDSTHKYNMKFKRFESHPNRYLCPNSELHTNTSVYARCVFDAGLWVSYVSFETNKPTNQHEKRDKNLPCSLFSTHASTMFVD